MIPLNQISNTCMNMIRITIKVACVVLEKPVTLNHYKYVISYAQRMYYIDKHNGLQPRKTTH